MADASGSLATPYAVSSQYTDATGRAGHASLYGGGCIDYGDPGGATCRFANAVTSTVGSDARGAASDQWLSGARARLACLTDDQLQAELTTMIGEMGLVHRTQPATRRSSCCCCPRGVDACLKVGGAVLRGQRSQGRVLLLSLVAHHVGRDQGSLRRAAVERGLRLRRARRSRPCPRRRPAKSWLSTAAHDLSVRSAQAQIAAIVNPGSMRGTPSTAPRSMTTLGASPFAKARWGNSRRGTAYFLQREFNNAGAIESDPRAQACEIRRGLGAGVRRAEPDQRAATSWPLTAPSPTRR